VKGEIAAMAENDRNVWTPEEDNRLRTLLEAGSPIPFVAADLKIPSLQLGVALMGSEYLSNV
jgi:hypothetical protein